MCIWKVTVIGRLKWAGGGTQNGEMDGEGETYLLIANFTLIKPYIALNKTE